MFKNLKTYLKETKKAATLLVTNDVNIAMNCDRIILMKLNPIDNIPTIGGMGNYNELLWQGEDLRIVKREKKEDEIGHVEGEKDVVVTIKQEAAQPTSDTHAHAHTHIACEVDEQDNDDCLVPPKSSGVSQSRRNQLASMDEVQSKIRSTVPAKTYLNYLEAVRSPALILLTILAYVVSNSASIGQQYKISQWADLPHHLSSSRSLANGYLRSITHAALLLAGCQFLRSFLTMIAGVRASEKIHGDMLSSVFTARMSFFDATPAGQLLQRFGRELETIDRQIPDQLGWVVTCFLSMFLSVLSMAKAVSFKLLIPISVLGVFYGKVMGMFRPASRDLKQVSRERSEPRAKRATSEASHERSEPRAKRATSEES